MSTGAQLLPQLFALLPTDQLDLMLARLSLIALHVESFHVRDDLFLATNPVIPGPGRTLRLRARRRRKRMGPKPPLRWAGSIDLGLDKVEGWDYSLTWVSPPLSAREYQEMRTQAVINLEVEGMSSKLEIEDFVQSLGFKHSHTYARMGHLFHLPIPGHPSLTLHLTVTRVLGPDDKPAEHVSEPYLVQLQPGRPVSLVAGPRELSLQDMMRVMREVTERIDGLEWETGREMK